jgi:D-alanyl-lipoteichoic acid acyltransferase DltB (MBOAT superfamily)
MKEKAILAFVFVCLSMFGFRGILPDISLSALVGLFTITGLIGCCYHLWHSKNKLKIGMSSEPDTMLLLSSGLIGHAGFGRKNKK